jgi:transcriptional regulator with XRE-family HTH domain
MSGGAPVTGIIACIKQTASQAGQRLRRTRLALGLRQIDLARRVGISQAWVSRMELGHGGSATLDVWNAVAAGVGFDDLGDLLVDRPTPGDRRHDIQRLVLDLAARGGWSGQSLGDDEIELTRDPWKEIGIVHVWDVVSDVDRAISALSTRVATQRSTKGAGWTVGGFVVVRAIAANRRRISEYEDEIDAMFPSTGSPWITALTDARMRSPPGPALVWTDHRVTRLIPARLTLVHRRR